MRKAKQLFEIFNGVWSITRNILHKTPDLSYEASGYAEFTTASEFTILYSEKLCLKNSLTGDDVTCYQVYKYIYDPLSDKLTKYFADDKFFYQLNILENKAFAKHLCLMIITMRNIVLIQIKAFL